MSQLRFDGREVSEILQKYGEVETDELPQGLTREQLADMKIGDEIIATVRFRLEAKNHDEKSDRQGYGVKPFRRKLYFKQLEVDFEITAIDAGGFGRKSQSELETASGG